MKLLRELYGRLDVLQQRRGFRIAAAIVVIVLCGTVFGPLIFTRMSLDSHRAAIAEALTGQRLERGDEHATSLLQDSSMTLNGRTYEDPSIQQNLPLVFDTEREGVIRNPAFIADRLVRTQYPAWAPSWLLEHEGTMWILATVTTSLLLIIVALPLTIQFVIAGLLTGAASLLGWWLGGFELMRAFLGMGTLIFAFLLLTTALMFLLNRRVQVFAVAHTVLKEASRTRLPIVFVVLLFIILPLLPMLMNTDQPLRDQIRTFISWSMRLTFMISACLTLMLACSTVAFEIRDRQIWQIVTKPVSRVNYLLGKWIGVVALNVVVVLIACLSIFTFIQYLREQPPPPTSTKGEDQMQIREDVLTARDGRLPEYFTLTAEQIDAQIERMIAITPEFQMKDEVTLEERLELKQDLLEAFGAQQRSVPPGGMMTYTFHDLERARDLAHPLTLRYRFHILRDDEHEKFPVAFVVDPSLQQPYIINHEYVPTMSHIVRVPASFIRDDGTLAIGIVNAFRPPPSMEGLGAINFDAKDLELLFRVDSFEWNFLRAALSDLIKLSFLAMLGICCASFLNFPVACLMSFTIFLSGALAPFLAESLQMYYPPAIAAVDWGDIGMVLHWLFRSVIRWIALAVVFLLEAFGETQTAQLLVEGRLISWGIVGQEFLRIGLIWTGIALLIGTLVIRKRQLAIYSGHG